MPSVWPGHTGLASQRHDRCPTKTSAVHQAEPWARFLAMTSEVTGLGCPSLRPRRYGSPGRGASDRLLPALVLERDAKLRPIHDPAVLCDVDVLRHDLGDPEIAKRPARRLDGSSRGVLPRLSTCSDEVRHSVNAHAILLARRVGCLPETVLPDRRSHRQEVGSDHWSGTLELVDGDRLGPVFR